MPLNSAELEAARHVDLSPRSALSVWLSSLGIRLRAFSPRAKKSASWEDYFIRELSRHVHARKWNEARRIALDFGSEAERRQEHVMMNYAAWALLRLESYPRAFQLFAQYRRWAGGRQIPEWDGSDLAGRVLLVDSPTGDISRYLHWVPLLDVVSVQAKRCILLTEPRMAPLYRRTFPRLDVITSPESPETLAEVDFIASFEGLAVHFWPERPAQTVKLKPNPELVLEFRSRYRELTARPIIGIAWGSLNRNKVCPDLRHWARLVAATSATFISVQYGDTAPALSVFDRLVPRRVISDPSVDQLVDLDRFAAQLAAIDAVVSISGTSAHMASALGVRTIVILDDEFHRPWPIDSDRTPWYDNTTLVRRARRPWRNVMAGVASLLRNAFEIP